MAAAAGAASLAGSACGAWVEGASAPGPAGAAVAGAGAAGAGFVAAGFGLALNLRFGPRASHYAVTILGAVAGGSISLRQVALHVVPGSGSYGNAFFGLHFYTWAFILFCLIVVGSAAMLLFDRQFRDAERVAVPLAGLAIVVVGLFAILTLGNGVSTLLECGAGLCPDNPTDYLLLKK